MQLFLIKTPETMAGRSKEVAVSVPLKDFYPDHLPEGDAGHRGNHSNQEVTSNFIGHNEVPRIQPSQNRCPTSPDYPEDLGSTEEQLLTHMDDNKGDKGRGEEAENEEGRTQEERDPVTDPEMDGYRDRVVASQKHRKTAAGQFVLHETLPPPDSKFYKLVNKAQNAVYDFWARHKRMFKRMLLVLLGIAYLVYLGFAIHYSVRGATALIVLTVLGVFLLLQTGVFKKPCQRCQKWMMGVFTSCIEGRIGTVLKW